MPVSKRFGCLISSIVLFGLAAGIVLITWQIVVKERVPTGYSGSPARGRQLMTKYGCTACHEVPGIAPYGMVGPSLRRMGSRSYIAGRIPNEPIMMAQWLEHPQRFRPGSAMPDLNVTSPDARDMAAYLATLK